MRNRVAAPRPIALKPRQPRFRWCRPRRCRYVAARSDFPGFVDDGQGTPAARRFARRATLYLVAGSPEAKSDEPSIGPPTGQPPKPSRNCTVVAEDLKVKT
jgi:hypothetical protein